METEWVIKIIILSNFAEKKTSLKFYVKKAHYILEKNWPRISKNWDLFSKISQIYRKKSLGTPEKWPHHL